MKTKVIFILFALSVLASCGKYQFSKQQRAYEGKWRLTHVETTYYSNGSEVDSTSEQSIDSEDVYLNFIFGQEDKKSPYKFEYDSKGFSNLSSGQLFIKTRGKHDVLYFKSHLTLENNIVADVLQFKEKETLQLSFIFADKDGKMEKKIVYDFVYHVDKTMEEELANGLSFVKNDGTTVNLKVTECIVEPFGTGKQLTMRFDNGKTGSEFFYIYLSAQSEDTVLTKEFVSAYMQPNTISTVVCYDGTESYFHSVNGTSSLKITNFKQSGTKYTVEGTMDYIGFNQTIPSVGDTKIKDIKISFTK